LPLPQGRNGSAKRLTVAIIAIAALIVLLAVTAIVAPQLFTPSTALAQAISLDADSGCLTKASPDALLYATDPTEPDALFHPTGPAEPDGLFCPTGLTETDGLFCPTGPTGPDGLFCPTGLIEQDGLFCPTGPTETDAIIATSGPSGPFGIFNSTVPSEPTALFYPTGPTELNGLFYPASPPDHDALFRDGPFEPEVTWNDRNRRYAEPPYGHRPPQNRTDDFAPPIPTAAFGKLSEPVNPVPDRHGIGIIQRHDGGKPPGVPVPVLAEVRGSPSDGPGARTALGCRDAGPNGSDARRPLRDGPGMNGSPQDRPCEVLGAAAILDCRPSPVPGSGRPEAAFTSDGFPHQDWCRPSFDRPDTED
jgi:hypothetical protein